MMGKKPAMKLRRDGEGRQQAQPRAPKVLRVAVLQEPTAFMATGGSQFKGGAGNVPPMAHETLVTENEAGVWEPRLAVEAISIEKGTWRVNADGSMDTTWTIRPVDPSVAPRVKTVTLTLVGEVSDQDN